MAKKTEKAEKAIEAAEDFMAYAKANDPMSLRDKMKERRGNRIATFKKRLQEENKQRLARKALREESRKEKQELRKAKMEAKKSKRKDK